VGTLQVCDEGLRATAGQCSVSASRLASQVPTAVVGPPTQATAEAVSGAYTALGATTAVLADRAQATDDKLTDSASRYMSTDETSAQHLSALGGRPVQV
jgi:hypothetical protein